MFKRFLKFLKGDEDVIDEHFEGSYFDHILTQVRPSIQASLEECSDHDPTLLLVVGILRGSMPNVWHPEMKKPLTDKRTPGKRPPPPPTNTPTHGVDTAEMEAVVDNSETDESTLERPEDRKAQAQNRITEEIDISELQEHMADELARDNTVEMDRSALEKGILPRIDSDDVLQAGRVFLSLLLDNDKLPAELQLSISETALARDLLLGYFVGNEDFEEKARKLLSLVEKKFADGLFSQARLLLQLFHTDDNTRITNDRNLFYEDMILRLGIKRRHKITEEDQKRFQELLGQSKEDDSFDELFGWLDQKCLIKFHLCHRTDQEVEEWKEALSTCSRDVAVENFLVAVPPKKWRLVEKVDLPLREQLRLHLGPESTQRYFVNHIRTCYFVLRAVGDTGLEPYLDGFFDWTKERFEVNGTTLMPLLYNRSMADNITMSEILREIHGEFFAEVAQAEMDKMSDDEIDAAIQKAIDAFKKMDLGEIAPGYYDLAGFVYDQIFGFKYPAPEFAAKLHRLT